MDVGSAGTAPPHHPRATTTDTLPCNPQTHVAAGASGRCRRSRDRQSAGRCMSRMCRTRPARRTCAPCSGASWSAGWGVGAGHRRLRVICWPPLPRPAHPDATPASLATSRACASPVGATRATRRGPRTLSLPLERRPMRQWPKPRTRSVVARRVAGSAGRGLIEVWRRR